MNKGTSAFVLCAGLTRGDFVLLLSKHCIGNIRKAYRIRLKADVLTSQVCSCMVGNWRTDWDVVVESATSTLH